MDVPLYGFAGVLSVVTWIEMSSHTGSIRGPLNFLCGTVLKWRVSQGLWSTEVFCC